MQRVSVPFYKLKNICIFVLFISLFMLSHQSYSKNKPCLRKQFSFMDKLMNLSFAGQFYIMKKSKIEINIGDKFSMLTVLKELPHKIYVNEKSITKCRQILCLCDCGNETIVRPHALISGKQKGCGCLSRTNPLRLIMGADIKNNIKEKENPIYHVWEAMKGRCYNPNNKRYKSYGGRGITIYEEWRYDFSSFYNWAINNGYKKELTIDRKDNDGNYCPDNCRWITKSEQNNNTSRNVFVEWKGEVLTLSQLCKKYNFNYKIVQNRVHLGWSIDDAINLPKYAKPKKTI